MRFLRSLTPALLALAAGCDQLTPIDLDPRDASFAGDAAPDRRDPTDVGPDVGPAADRDDGPDHSSGPDLAPGPDREPPSCPIGPVRIGLSAAREPGSIERRLQGPATIDSWFPDLSLTFADGERVEIRGEIVNGEWPQPLISSRVIADVLIRQPFWTEVSLHLTTTLTAAPAPIPAQSFTAWSTSRPDVPVGATQRLTYITTACAERDRCGGLARRQLTYTTLNGAVVVAAPGEHVDTGRVIVVNGDSHQYIGDVRCQDVPAMWTSGYVFERGF